MKVYVINFSCVDVDDNDIKTLIIDTKHSGDELLQILKDKLKEYFVDLFDDDEFEEYWEESDFEDYLTLEEGGWCDCNDNPFFCSIMEVL